MSAHDLLARLGLAPGEVLGRGAEGVAVALPDDRVAKVWHQPALERARAAAAVLEALAASGLPFATPRVLEVLDPGDTDGTTVTIETLLPGVSLGRSYADPDGPPLVVDDHRVDCLVSVLGGLASVSAVDAMARLPVLPGEVPFDPAVPFTDSLAALVERRTALARGPLLARLSDLDAVVAATVRALGDLPDVRPVPLHGDLVPTNVHVEGPGGGVVAVLDLGFLTTLGDPAFDAAVTASIYDMYGPQHRRSEAVLDEAFTTRLGRDPHAMAVYRAAYALATATVFDADGLDGHFDWCVAMLERPDVRQSTMY